MSPDIADDQCLLEFFDAAADRYEGDIVPAFRPFAEAVARTAEPRGHQRVLDVGTGTGILARVISKGVSRVVGVDISGKMIDRARVMSRDEGVRNVEFRVADARCLPFRDGEFDLVVSSLGLHGADPAVVFRELRRVLGSDGELVFHEWATPHRFDRILESIISRHAVAGERASEELRRVRAEIALMDRVSCQLRMPDYMNSILKSSGFRKIFLSIDSPVDCVMTFEAFLRYKLAWPDRCAELQAMGQGAASECLVELRHALAKAINDDGNIHYDPSFVRVRAGV